MKFSCIVPCILWMTTLFIIINSLSEKLGRFIKIKLFQELLGNDSFASGFLTKRIGWKCGMFWNKCVGEFLSVGILFSEKNNRIVQKQWLINLSLRIIVNIICLVPETCDYSGATITRPVVRQPDGVILTTVWYALTLGCSIPLHISCHS